MSTVQQGDTVKVHYTGTLTDGSVFDSSIQREPLEFTLGQGQLIPGFEQTVLGMEVGDKATTEIPAKDAYGEVREELTMKANKTDLPPDLTPELGMQLQLSQPNGQPVPVIISEIEEETVTLDANHPLAGKDLTFEIELVEIV
ncbi:MAG: peptidylprolyl isomerase [Bacteroidota bacterium]